LTDGPADHRPVWSPDGQFLVYQTLDPAGGEALARVDLQGEQEPKLLARGTGPTFTPDGEWVVYAAKTRAGLRLWKMHPDGTGKRRLGSSPHEEADPAVSPDGRFVAFVSVQDERNRLVVRAMDGRGGDRPLITDGEGLRPVW
jgi:TolB protein